MRGATLFAASTQHAIVTRHDVKFGCYHALKRHVRTLATGTTLESQWLGLSQKESEVLTTFWGVTRWPGKRQLVTSRSRKKETRYIPRPNWYRAGSPLVLVTLWRLRNVEGLHTAQELVDEENKRSGSNYTVARISEIKSASRVHMLRLNPEAMQEWKDA